ncbi:type I-E CRISPR-associated protein Cse2/CasB [Streptomyces sp. NPDC090025]|uniref:type I-E CRISPR-associated protein Cse2/CasB n=1 Tax=Streptomyces sp. NPDC090025 TaxID=3365922 RepID=UPI003835274C
MNSSPPDLTRPEGERPPPVRHEALARYDTFVSEVLELCRCPGTQQALRAGLGRTLDDMPGRTHAALLRHGLMPGRLSNTDKRAFYAVAALVAARPRAERRADDEPARTDVPVSSAGDEPAPPVGDVPAQRAGDVPAQRAGQEAGGRTPRESGVERPEPKASWGTSLGETLAGLNAHRDRDRAAAPTGGASPPPDRAEKISGVEQRLHLLVRQDIDNVHRMLPPLVRQLGSAGLAVDYGRLLSDLVQWPYRRGDVTLRWLEDYYRTLRRADPSA